MAFFRLVSGHRLMTSTKTSKNFGQYFRWLQMVFGEGRVGGIFLVRPHLRTANLLFSLYIKFSNYCLASVTLLSSCNFFGRTCFKDSSFFLTPTVAASVCSDNVINNFEFVIACEILILRYYSFGIFCSNFDILSIDEVCF